MVEQPEEYRWSSYRYNAMDMGDPLVVPHDGYLSLAPNKVLRLEAYRALFDNVINEQTLKAIREATNRAWVLGGDRFRNEIEDLLQRQAAPKTRGGDRKSQSFQVRRKINRV